jgi:hypothetical protein
VSHAGLVLLRHLADRTGLTGGLSRALATPRILVHDRGRVLADLACAIADGARVISGFRVMSDQGELFGLVASVPMITVDGAGASHELIKHLDKLAARPGYQVIYSVGWALTEREKTALRLVPGQAWQIAIDGRGEVRERRADDACADMRCAHRTCWVEEAHVAELTGLLREGPGGDQLQGWPDGWRYSLWVTNRPAATKGWLGQNGSADERSHLMTHCLRSRAVMLRLRPRHIQRDRPVSVNMVRSNPILLE